MVSVLCMDLHKVMRYPCCLRLGSNSSTMIMVLLAALAVGGAGYYLKIYKPKHDLDDADDFDDLTGGEDEETINEDDEEPV